LNESIVVDVVEPQSISDNPNADFVEQVNGEVTTTQRSNCVDVADDGVTTAVVEEPGDGTGSEGLVDAFAQASVFLTGHRENAVAAEKLLIDGIRLPSTCLICFAVNGFHLEEALAAYPATR
jgi:ABC-type proline/glycine betaine transport system ATPase subunit